MSAPPIATGGRSLYPAIAELASIPQWVIWQPEKRGAGKSTKVPYCVGGRRKAAADKPDTWDTFDACYRSAFVDDHVKDGGVGFVVTKETGIIGVDCDNCIDQSGNIDGPVLRWINRFNSYAEISPSGKGIRIFCRGTMPVDGLNPIDSQWEAYCARRFLTVTGDHLDASPPVINEAQEAVDALLAVLTAGKVKIDQGNGHDKEPVDREALRKALTGETPGAWHTAMLSMVAHLVSKGAEDWFIVDWALQYRWHGYGEAETRRDVQKMIAGARAKGWAPTAAAGTEDEFPREARRLAQLPPHEYDRVRKTEANRLAVRTATLDAAVEAIRGADRSDDFAARGQALDLPEPEAWPAPVESVLNDLIAAIRKYVSLDEHKALAVSLWAVHAHCMEWAYIAPRLHITSPAPNCGKTVLLDTVARLVPRPLLISNISPAGIFRTIEACRPCMLVDEFDAFGTDDEQTRGLLNSGHTRTSAFVVRVVDVGGDLEPRRFSTWGALAVAGIGKVPATIASRSIVIEMARKLPGDRVARLTHRGGHDLDVLCRKIARWTADNRARLEAAAPDVPAQLSNRAADNWAELLTVAALHGDDWAERARRAALSLTSTDTDDAGYGIALLEDIKTAIGKAEQISTENLLKHLHAMTERPWCEYGRQRKPISPRLLAGLLKPFGIASNTLREGDTTYKGYRCEQFQSAWDRYLSVTPSQPKQTATFCDFSSVTSDPNVTDRNSEKTKQSATCDGVTDENPPLEEDDEFDRWIRP